MKAIYINLDPYLAAVAAWLKGGRSGPAPTFQPLPVAVTIPLGESAAIFLQGQSANDPTGPVQDWGDFDSNYITVDGYSMYARLDISSPGDILDGLSVPGFSALAPAAQYVVTPITDSVDVSVLMGGTGVDDPEITFSITVLVRRETASGPVDLVDFTPPPDMRGVSLAGAIIQATGDEETATLYTAGESTSVLKVGNPSELPHVLGGSSAS